MTVYDEQRLELAIKLGFIRRYIDRHGTTVYQLTREGAIQWMQYMMKKERKYGKA